MAAIPQPETAGALFAELDRRLRALELRPTTVIGTPRTLVMVGVAQPLGAANRTAYNRSQGSGRVTAIGLEVGVASGSIQLGVYSNTGTGRTARPATLKAWTAEVAVGATGPLEVPLITPIDILDGDWLAVAATSATFQAGTASSTTSTARFTGLQHLEDVWPLPTMATPSAVGVGRVPYLWTT